ncbi:MAG: hypothetical protein HY870_19580 [Chloroflexi bacterium]|nr:hypothetical protein [Chloroflexota bacterium]
MNRKMVWSLIAFGALLIGLMSFSVPVSAGPLALPPRPTPVPTVTPVVASAALAKGGIIELQAGVGHVSQWTFIEWQDDADRWHTVDGWQGTIDAAGKVVWWVSPSDLGKGPFRWSVADRLGGATVATSTAFNLPSYSGQRVFVEVQP